LLSSHIIIFIWFYFSLSLYVAFFL
jgi:hypothetical protein